MDIIAITFLAFFCGFFAAFGAILAFEILRLATGKGRAVFLTYSQIEKGRGE